METIDFLSIGDAVVDDFIRLKDAEAHCDINHEHCTICLRFGDKVPFEEVTVVPAVGNAANAAVSASRLGLSSALVTNLGDDKEGQDCLEALKKDKVLTDYVKINSGVKDIFKFKFEDFTIAGYNPHPSIKAPIAV